MASRGVACGAGVQREEEVRGAQGQGQRCEMSFRVAASTSYHVRSPSEMYVRFTHQNLACATLSYIFPAAIMANGPLFSLYDFGLFALRPTTVTSA